MEVTVQDCEIRPANDWIRGSKKRPIPRALFGEFWREGETAVLFADTGKGKSALAMQIAESIARCKGIGPFQMCTEPQNVLHLDLEMNEKQFETRYAADHDGGRARFLHKHYKFSDNLYREELDPADFWVRGERPCDVFCRKVRQLVNKSKASVVIIDSITSLKRSYYGSRETLDLMSGLKRLRKELNISILALVQTPKRPDSLPLTANNLQGLRMLCGRADSVFGIGQSRFDPTGRYIKRVRTLGDAMDFDAMHVPLFRLKKIGGNFLGFEFEGFAPEIELVSDIRDQREWETIERIKQLSDGGKSIREIAAEIDLPKTTVHRLLQMWRPPIQSEMVEPDDGEALYIDEPVTDYSFPGREEYDEAGRDPRFNNIYDREGEEFAKLRREAYLIQLAAANARQEYLKTGKAPKLAEMLERMAAAETVAGAGAVAGAGGNESVPRAVATGDLSGDEQSAIRISQSAMERDGLKRSLDDYGHEIFIEKEDEQGKRQVWYNFDSKGRKHRKVRKGNTVMIEQME